MCNCLAVTPRHQKISITPEEKMRRVRDAMTIFGQGGQTEIERRALGNGHFYDNHMEKTGHYPLMKAGLASFGLEGRLDGRKIVDVGCGSGKLLGFLLKYQYKDHILHPARGEMRNGAPVPFEAFGIDATPVMMQKCCARMLRQMHHMIEEEKDPNLRVYGFNAESGRPSQFSLDARFDPSAGLLSRIGLYRRVQDGARANVEMDGVPLQELLRVNLMLTDVLELTDEQKVRLSGADVFLVSYCFHWFPDKMAVARLIGSLMGEKSRFISIEESLHVTKPKIDTATLDKEARDAVGIFYQKLTDAIRLATTPVKMPDGMYRLFQAAGLHIEPFGKDDSLGYLKRPIDTNPGHDMYFAGFRKTESGIYF